MSKTIAAEKTCPMEIGINILSGKWKLKILYILSKNPIRFNALQKSLNGITTRTLTSQLRELEQYKIITRTIYPEVPPRVEYCLSELGETLIPILKSLCDWGKVYIQYNNELL